MGTPFPSSLTLIEVRPPPDNLISMFLAPASREFLFGRDTCKTHVRLEELCLVQIKLRNETNNSNILKKFLVNEWRLWRSIIAENFSGRV